MEPVLSEGRRLTLGWLGTMRTLSVLALISAVMVTGCRRDFAEVCRDDRDNDGDGLFDEGCLETGIGEICANFIDDDEDGVVDCMDADCFAETFCQTEVADECFDGFDNDLDGLTDCDDDDCSLLTDCTGGARWTLWGEATVTDGQYTGRKVLEVRVADTDAGMFNLGDILCASQWEHNGFEASGCTDCEFAFDLTSSSSYTESGPYCSYWRDFRNPDSQDYYGVGSGSNAFPAGLGYNPAYDGGGTVFPALMFEYGYGGWRALPSRTEFTWDEDTGEFWWSLLWAYDYYR